MSWWLTMMSRWVTTVAPIFEYLVIRNVGSRQVITAVGDDGWSALRVKSACLLTCF